jgi:AraC-like DNA-binding protein
MGLKEYISEHKMHLIEHRIKNSDLHFKEISYAFGFSDLSHFNKFFKTHKGISPSAYRKNTQIF